MTLSLIRQDVERDIAEFIQKLEGHHSEQKLAQILHTDTKNNEAKPARVGLTDSEWC
jgi:hypothetical protein